MAARKQRKWIKGRGQEKSSLKDKLPGTYFLQLGTPPILYHFPIMPSYYESIK
jgi:hypothetical protein